nr:hypothetical protein CFP56_60307 [Quercus suber]
MTSRSAKFELQGRKVVKEMNNKVKRVGPVNLRLRERHHRDVFDGKFATQIFPDSILVRVDQEIAKNAGRAAQRQILLHWGRCHAKDQILAAVMKHVMAEPDPGTLRHGPTLRTKDRLHYSIGVVPAAWCHGHTPELCTVGEWIQGKFNKSVHIRTNVICQIYRCVFVAMYTLPCSVVKASTAAEA